MFSPDVPLPLADHFKQSLREADQRDRRVALQIMQIKLKMQEARRN